MQKRRSQKIAVEEKALLNFLVQIKKGEQEEQSALLQTGSVAAADANPLRWTMNSFPYLLRFFDEISNVVDTSLT